MPKLTRPDWAPPTQELPAPPPPPSGTHAKAGLARDQAIRADAAAVASSLLGGGAGTSAGIAARLVELAEPIADWIRDGTDPAREVYHSIHGDPHPPMTTDQFETYLEQHPSQTP